MTPEMKQAFMHVHDPWTPSRLANGRAGLEKKRVRRRVTRVALLTTTTAAAAFMIALKVPSFTETEMQSQAAMLTEPSNPLTDGALVLSDGSFAEPLTPDTALAVEAESPSQVRIALLDGAARFDVVRNPGRKFVVMVKSVRIEVIGTCFDVTLDTSRVHVRVLRGHVRVTWPRGRRDLLASQSGLFPLDDGAPVAAAEAEMVFEPDEAVGEPDASAAMEAVAEVQARAAPQPSNEAPVTGDWRVLARQGDYESAFRASREQAVSESIDDLWLAADAARLSGHPREAITYLERAMALHPSDGRVHLAAFTLGRLHLQLGLPAQAASNFAQVERLDRRGVLTEQALAREVEAWARAGNEARARDRAGVYLRRFPSGNYAERVRRFSSSQ